MLYINFTNRDNAIATIPNLVWHAPSYFDNNYEDGWLDDELVKEMVLDVDKSTILSHNCIESPVLGQITPTKISGGVKALILMLKWEDKVIYASSCGDNCSKWIVEIAKHQDLHIALGYIMRFGSIDDRLDAIIENNGSHITTVREYLDLAMEYL